MKQFILRVGTTAQIVSALLALAVWPPADAATLLSSEPAFNSRVVRLDHAPSPEARGRLVALALTPAGGRHIEVYAADSDDAPFRPIGRISDPVFASGVCCGTLYELPRRVGSLREGTLLWAGSIGHDTADKHMAIRIYRSDDGGRNWTFLSNVESPRPGQIWEPEFTVGQDGALILFHSDETEATEYSQFIRKIRTYDGVRWQDPGYVVASKILRDRPGMPVSRRLADGRWMMTYELCGPAHCIARYRLSNDGWNWGNPTQIGSEIRLPNGAFPAHAPRFTVAPNGAILLAAQLIETPALKPGARSGRVLLVNDTGDPATLWRTIAAPVPVPDACSETCKAHQWCPNYSSALLIARNGVQVLEVASDWTDRGCFSSYAWASWRRDASPPGQNAP
ncbi:MAG TPA: sialidase family protein [Steroidobacteraceae bacterium]